MVQPRVVSASRALVIALLAGACLLGAAAQATAAPVTIYMNYRLVSGQGAADAVVVFDDSLLAPGTFDNNLADLTSFDITLTELPTSPSSTSLTKADLNGWALSVDSNGHINDLNFFMGNPAHTNGDGYSVNGTEVQQLSAYQGDPATGTRIAVFQGFAAQQQRAIPTLSAAGVGLLVLLLAGAAVVALRRSGA